MTISEHRYDPDDFAGLRHIGPSKRDLSEMVQELGFGSERELVSSALPPGLGTVRLDGLGNPLTEHAALELIRATASRNTQVIPLIGMGYHRTATPPVIQRNIFENPAWYTAYTPYQPEISQGRLEVLLDFQTMVCDLTGMEVANASLLDEATAGAEAMAMARRVSRSRSQCFFVDCNCHPQTINVVRTRARALGIDIRIGCPEGDLHADGVFGALLQSPGTDGTVRDFSSQIERLHETGAVAVGCG